MIRDARHMFGADSPEEVRSRWHDMLATVNAARGLRGDEALRLADAGATLHAYVNHGRWVADCECGGGIGCWAEMDDAACMDCGRIWRIAFPSARRRAAGEAVLAERPERNRNWVPADETLGRLRTENELLMGVM